MMRILSRSNKARGVSGHLRSDEDTENQEYDDKIYAIPDRHISRVLIIIDFASNSLQE